MDEPNGKPRQPSPDGLTVQQLFEKVKWLRRILDSEKDVVLSPEKVAAIKRILGRSEEDFWDVINPRIFPPRPAKGGLTDRAE